MTDPGGVGADPIWVVGAGGLLGRAVVSAAGRHGATPFTAGVPWHDAGLSRDALRAAMDRFLQRAGNGAWSIAWCAGSGVVASTAVALERERHTFAGFLEDLSGRVGDQCRGALFLASSAGGVYAGSSDPPFTERTEPRPLAPYGELKLAMESSVRDFCARTGTRGLVGRIANLYGPGQNLAKPQGLVSALCKSHVTGQPVSIYVPLETTRDYLFVTDCGEMVVAGLSRVHRGSAAGSVVEKIFASGQPVTVAALLGQSNRLHRRRTPISVGTSSRSARQVLDLRLRSVTWPELDAYARTPLPVGMAATQAEIARWHAQGRL